MLAPMRLFSYRSVKMKIMVPTLVLKEMELQLEEKGRKGRIARSDDWELKHLRGKGADLLPDIELKLLQEFSAADRTMRDQYIRREIRNYILGPTLPADACALLLTSDNTNAQMASNEGLSTLLFRRLEPILWGAREIASLLVDLAIKFYRIEVRSSIGEKLEKYAIEGDWSTKTLRDWESQSTRLLSLARA